MRRGNPGGAALIRLRSGVADALHTWLDAVFVPRCLGCDASGSHFCDRCLATLRPLPAPYCDSCGQPVAPGATTCPECQRARLPLAAVRSVATLDGPLRRAVHRLKYRGRAPAARTLADLLLAPVAALLARSPLVIPVPLDAARERERGYNQAALLARPLAGRLALPCRPDLLRRTRPTPPQVGLSRARRRENVRGAFAAGGALAGRDVLLVDDVTTTGSTLGSAALALREAGAGRVFAVTLAREA